MSATSAAQVPGTLPGSEFPLGATVTDTGTNFAVASEVTAATHSMSGIRSRCG